MAFKTYDPDPGFNPYATDPQSSAVKAGKLNAYLSGKETEALSKDATVEPAVRVTTIDGVPTVVARAPVGAAGVGQQVSEEDLRALGEEPLRFPVCEFPKCKGEGRNQIISSAGLPLSINREGQLVFGDPQHVDAHPMSANDKARALAQGLANTLGTEASEIIVSPSHQVGQRVAKCHVDVCDKHNHLPHAPRKPRTLWISGPYPSYFSARRRAAGVGLRTRHEPSVLAARDGDREVWYVRGDDGAPGYKGGLTAMQ
jgi:hypothetical protein